MSTTRERRRAGWVYVLTNPGLRRGLVKIGYTTRTPKVRARELSSSTGVPLPFEVAWAVQVRDCRAVERAVHQALASSRLPRREFFEVSRRRAIRAVKRAAAAYRPRHRAWGFALMALLTLAALAAGAWAWQAGLLTLPALPW